jgi:hypothetical protein
MIQMDLHLALRAENFDFNSARVSGWFGTLTATVFSQYEVWNNVFFFKTNVNEPGQNVFANIFAFRNFRNNLVSFSIESI